jgi:DNA modification methylase
MADGHIGDLTPDGRNARRHNPRNVGMIEAALREVGAARSIVVDENGVILAGNATIEAAAAAGIERVITVDADGETIIAVRRSNLTDEQKKKLALWDNRTAELAEWDPAVLDELSTELDLNGMFYDDELAGILADLAKPVPLTDSDAVPEPPADPITKPGDLWLMGEHRLLCGDATVVTDVDRLMAGEKAVLMATDPPYGVDFAGAKYNPRAKPWAAIEGDKRQGGDLRAWLGGCIGLWLDHLASDAACYFWSAAMKEGFATLGAIRDAGLHVQAQIIWSKNTLVLGQADYQWKHENCWYAFRKGANHRWFGGRAQTTVWEIDKVANAAYVHPMQKPTELFALPMRNHTHPGEVCAEPFAGSGSQVIAAEQEGRRCYSMEVDPAHCDVIVQRWQDFTGQQATRAVS